jgi:hypothetical protein
MCWDHQRRRATRLQARQSLAPSAWRRPRVHAAVPDQARQPSSPVPAWRARRAAEEAVGKGRAPSRGQRPARALARGSPSPATGTVPPLTTAWSHSDSVGDAGRPMDTLRPTGVATSDADSKAAAASTRFDVSVPAGLEGPGYASLASHRSSGMDRSTGVASSQLSFDHSTDESSNPISNSPLPYRAEPMFAGRIGPQQAQATGFVDTGEPTSTEILRDLVLGQPHDGFALRPMMTIVGKCRGKPFKAGSSPYGARVIPRRRELQRPQERRRVIYPRLWSS